MKAPVHRQCRGYSRERTRYGPAIAKVRETQPDREGSCSTPRQGSLTNLHPSSYPSVPTSDPDDVAVRGPPRDAEPPTADARLYHARVVEGVKPFKTAHMRGFMRDFDF